MTKRRAVIDELVATYPDYCSTFTFKLQKGIPGRTIHKEGFVNCYWDPKRKLVYMHIDKCGSTSITTAFNYHKKEFLKMDDMEDPENLAKHLVKEDNLFFTVVRDPKSRWISGLNEFMCRFKPPIDYVIDQIKNNKYVFDEHTAPQHIFLRLVLENGGNIKFLKLDSTLSSKVNGVLLETITDKEQRYHYNDLDIPHLRMSKYFIPNYTSICKKIYATYIEENSEKFDELYKLDYELYEKGL
jgi:hypothetical protein